MARTWVLWTAAAALAATALAQRSRAVRLHCFLFRRIRTFGMCFGKCFPSHSCWQDSGTLTTVGGRTFLVHRCEHAPLYLPPNVGTSYVYHTVWGMQPFLATIDSRPQPLPQRRPLPWRLRLCCAVVPGISVHTQTAQYPFLAAHRLPYVRNGLLR